MGSMKWTVAQGGLNMQCKETLLIVRVWLGEYDCLWLQKRPRHEIEVGPVAGALRRLAGDLGVLMDDFGDDSVSEWDEAGPSRSGRFLDEDLTGWDHGRGSKRFMRRADFNAASDLFGLSGAGVLGDGLGGVRTGGPVPTCGIGRVAQVVPALPQTPRRASPVVGDRRALRWQWRMWTWGARVWGGRACICEGVRWMRVLLHSRASRGMGGDGIAGETDEGGGDGGPYPLTG